MTKVWHPEPNVIECTHCGAKFHDGGKVVDGFGPVKMPATVYQQIHDMAYSYNGGSGMCGLPEADRKKWMQSAPLPQSQEA